MNGRRGLVSAPLRAPCSFSATAPHLLKLSDDESNNTHSTLRRSHQTAVMNTRSRRGHPRPYIPFSMSRSDTASEVESA